MTQSKKKERVLLIGLDGAVFSIIEPLVKKGKMPNFARIMKEGVYGPLESTMPPVTPCAWTSMVTGKHPSKHGIYDFTQIQDNDPSKRVRPNSTYLRAKPIWTLLSEAGKQSIVVDVPLTFPPSPLNGTMISRVMSTPKKNCTYPKSLYRALKKKGFIKQPQQPVQDQHQEDGEKPAEPPKPRRRRKLTPEEMKKMGKERVEKAFKHMCEEIDENLELADWLMKRHDWDFMMFVFMAPDHAGHTFWHDQSKVRKIYQKLDEAVGKLFDMVGEDTVKFIASDHGFATIPYNFNVNEWLCDKGLLAKKLDIPGKESMAELKGLLAKNRVQKKTRGRKKQEKLQKFRFQLTADYSKTKAFLQSGTVYGIRINLEGRDKTGIVSQKDFEKFRRSLMKELKELRHSMTRDKIFSRVVKKEDVYSESPFGMDPAPDIFLVPKDMKVMMNAQFQQVRKVFGKARKGYGFHHTHGIFLAHGEGIAKKKLTNPHITDLTPTMLHVLGIPLPEDIDGKVLKQVFKKSSDYASRDVGQQDASILEREEKAYSAKQEKQIEKQLAALGYIE